jgi:threonine aldolase
VLSLDYLAAVRSLAQDHGVRVHMDGARIFNAALACGTDVAKVASYADSVQFCLSKGLSAPVGSMVVGDWDFVAAVRRIRKMLGGGMRQSGLLAAAGQYALNHMVARLADDHTNAKRLAAGLAGIAGIDLDPRPVEINMVFFGLSDARFTIQRFIAHAADRGVRIAELGRGRIRCVTHSGVSADDIDYALRVFAEILAH